MNVAAARVFQPTEPWPDRLPGSQALPAATTGVVCHLVGFYYLYLLFVRSGVVEMIFELGGPGTRVPWPWALWHETLRPHPTLVTLAVGAFLLLDGWILYRCMSRRHGTTAFLWAAGVLAAQVLLTLQGVLGIFSGMFGIHDLIR